MGNAKDSTGTELATSEQKRLDELEATITAGLQGAAEVAPALREIRDSRLYRATHKSFDDYCREAWGWDRTYVHRIIDAGIIREMLPIGNVKPPSEAVMRELAPLKDEPQKMVGAWQQAVETYGKPTAAQVRKIVQPAAPVLPPAEPAPEEVPASEVEVADPPVAEAKAKRVSTTPVPHEPTRSPATLASFTRAMRAALKDGWSLQEIADAGDKVIRGEE